MANKYFTPLDAFGTQTFQQAGEPAGWYQFLVDVPVVPTIPIVLRDIAQGVLIQAISEVRYCLSPSAAAAGTTAYLVLPAGTTLFLSGAQAMRQFCILLPAAGAEFVVQIYTGNIGPIPLIHQPGTIVPPGPPPPPPPGGAVVPTSNTLHVMAAPWGNDASGTRERLDLPFLTCAAAEAAASNGDTIMVWDGTYNVQDLGTKRLFYVLHGATLNSTTGSVFTTAEDVDVTGSGLIQGNAGVPAVAIVGGRTITINGVDVQSNDIGVQIKSGTLRMRGSIRASSYALITPNTASTAQIYGNVTSQNQVAIFDSVGLSGYVVGNVTSNTVDAISITAGDFRVYGTVQGEGVGLVATGSAEVVVHGRVYSALSTGIDASANSGRVSIYGNVYGSDGILLSGGQVLVYGNVEASTGNGIDQNGGVLYVSGNVTGINNGYAVSGGSGQVMGNIECPDEGLVQTGGTVQVGGNITSTNVAGGDRAATISGGTCDIQGTVRTLGLGGAVLCNLTGTVTVQGDCIADQVASGMLVQGGGRAIVYGRCIGGSNSAGLRMLNGTGSARAEVYGLCSGGISGVQIQNSAGCEVHVRGEVAGGTNGGIDIDAGTVYVYGLVRATVINTNAIRFTDVSTVLYLMASARLVALGTGMSVRSYAPTGQALPFNTYYASGNTLPEGSLLPNGVFNVVT